MDSYDYDVQRDTTTIPYGCVLGIAVFNGLSCSAGALALGISLFQGMREGENNAAKIAFGTVSILVGASILACTSWIIKDIAKDCFKKQSYTKIPDTVQKV